MDSHRIDNRPCPIQHGAHVGPVGPRWAPCWPHGPCYQGCCPILDSIYTTADTEEFTDGCDNTRRMRVTEPKFLLCLDAGSLFIALSPKHSGKYHNRPLSCDHSSCSSCSAIFPDTSSSILNAVICWSICALCIYLLGGLVINSQFLKWPSMFWRVVTQEQRTIASLKSPWWLWAVPKCDLPKQIMGKWLLHAYWDYSVPTKQMGQVIELRLVTWFCYQIITKSGNKTVAPLWPDWNSSKVEGSWSLPSLCIQQVEKL